MSPHAEWRIVVPTRNSGQWIRQFIQEYRRLGVQPLYLLDNRSSDDTGLILREEGVEVITVALAADRVEAAMSLIPESCPSTWVLRLDDDELPSAALLSWIEAHLSAVQTDAVAVHRRWCLFGRDGIMRYSRAEMFYWNDNRPELLDPQTRLFRPDRVRYANQIHTPGFSVPLFEVAPSFAPIFHFDWILRSLSERLNKIHNYEAQEPGAGSNFAHFYLPECLCLERLRETDFETNELAALAAALANYRLLKLLAPIQ